MLPVTSFSTTRLVVGQEWSGEAYLWGGHTDVYRLGNGTCLTPGIGTTDWLHHCFTFTCVVSLNSAFSRLIIFIPIFSFPGPYQYPAWLPPHWDRCSKCSWTSFEQCIFIWRNFSRHGASCLNLQRHIFTYNLWAMWETRTAGMEVLFEPYLKHYWQLMLLEARIT